MNGEYLDRREYGLLEGMSENFWDFAVILQTGQIEPVYIMKQREHS